LTGSPKVVLK